MPDDEPKKKANEQQAQLEQLDRAYSRLFDPKSADAVMVLADLKRICFVEASTYGPGMTQMDMNINEGCRRVWLRIQQKIRMDFSTALKNRPKSTL